MVKPWKMVKTWKDFSLKVKYHEPEFDDIYKVMESGAKKHGRSNWLTAQGRKSSFKEMHDSMFHHLVDSYAGLRADKDSGLDPLLHLSIRALMLYTRIKRGIGDAKQVTKYNRG